MKRLLLLLALWAVLAPAAAMTLVVQGKAVFATGPVEDDYGKFVEALKQPGIERVVLVNSPGGDLWTGMRIGRLIADQGLHTVAAGYCSSSCSIMFMGGRTRSFSDVFKPQQTYLGLHGPHNRDTKQVNPQQATQIYAFFKQQMGSSFNADVVNKALYEMDDAGALLRVFDPTRLPARVTYHCRAGQTLRKDCTELKGHDALSLGLVTTTELTPVELPDKLRATPMVFGRDLSQVIPNPADFFGAMTAAQCLTDSCRKLVADFLTAQDDRAIALPVLGRGLGTAHQRDRPEQAFLSALYACNHVRNQAPRLCEVHAINGVDFRDMYAREQAETALAIAGLKPPAERFFANEEFGGSLTSARGLRTHKMVDITPQSLEGVPVLGTQALARELQGAKPPILIDVGYSPTTLPGAKSLVFGGFAYDELAKEQAYEGRFLGLLRLLSPDPSAPLVFFARNREWWHGVNASLRARKLGYTQVGWYRGGLESWQAAGLPVMPTVVRAVVQ